MGLLRRRLSFFLDSNSFVVLFFWVGGGGSGGGGELGEGFSLFGQGVIFFILHMNFPW